MHKELLALFGLELLTLNLYNCVHSFLLYFKGFFREAAHVRAHFTLPQRTLTGCKGTNFIEH